MRGSLFVATFDMPRHLELVLTALERQSTRDFEVFICDDGSGPATKAVVDRFSKNFPVPLAHVWQEHAGFRKCKILNEALRRARGEVCIFLDGDCVPHRDFVLDHLEQQEAGRYLAGRRVELGQAVAERITPKMIADGYLDWPHPGLIRDFISGDSEHFQRTLRWKHPLMRKLLKLDRIDDLKGCNYSVSRHALIDINGFDESYEGYGREDTDVELRLQHLGLRIKSLKGLALQFHFWHPRREFTPANDSKLEEVRKLKIVRCERGLE